MGQRGSANKTRKGTKAETEGDSERKIGGHVERSGSNGSDRRAIGWVELRDLVGTRERMPGPITMITSSTEKRGSRIRSMKSNQKQGSRGAEPKNRREPPLVNGGVVYTGEREGIEARTSEPLNPAGRRSPNLGRRRPGEPINTSR